MASPRVAIVTGAAGDLGKVIALRLANDGFDVAVNDLPIRKDDVDALVGQISERGSRSLAVIGDVSAEEDVKNIVERTANELGSVDVVRACLTSNISRSGELAEQMVSNVAIFKAVSLDQS